MTKKRASKFIFISINKTTTAAILFYYHSINWLPKRKKKAKNLTRTCFLYKNFEIVATCSCWTLSSWLFFFFFESILFFVAIRFFTHLAIFVFCGDPKLIQCFFFWCYRNGFGGSSRGGKDLMKVFLVAALVLYTLLSISIS